MRKNREQDKETEGMKMEVEREKTSLRCNAGDRDRAREIYTFIGAFLLFPPARHLSLQRPTHNL